MVRLLRWFESDCSASGNAIGPGFRMRSLFYCLSDGVMRLIRFLLEGRGFPIFIIIVIIFRVFDALLIDLVNSIVSFLWVNLLELAIVTTLIKVLFRRILEVGLIRVIEDGTGHVLLEGHAFDEGRFFILPLNFGRLLHNTFILYSKINHLLINPRRSNVCPTDIIRKLARGIYGIGW